MIERKKDFESYNLALDRLMSAGVSDFDEPAVHTATLADSAAPEREATQAELVGAGRLIAQVTTANGALPVQGATVTTMTTDGEVIEVQTTNNSGRTLGVELPAPLAKYSQTPGGIRPYSTYNLRVENPGYYTQELLNIAVFDRIESIQPISMEPLGEDSLEGDRLER